MREWFPNVKEVKLHKAGHNVHVDDRSGFLDALNQWL
jgi:pimeloyl-ACP methyl ester carboxylesterase